MFRNMLLLLAGLLVVFLCINCGGNALPTMREREDCGSKHPGHSDDPSDCQVSFFYIPKNAGFEITFRI